MPRIRSGYRNRQRRRNPPRGNRTTRRPGSNTLPTSQGCPTRHPALARRMATAPVRCRSSRPAAGLRAPWGGAKGSDDRVRSFRSTPSAGSVRPAELSLGVCFRESVDGARWVRRQTTLCRHSLCVRAISVPSCSERSARPSGLNPPCGLGDCPLRALDALRSEPRERHDLPSSKTFPASACSDDASTSRSIQRSAAPVFPSRGLARVGGRPQARSRRRAPASCGQLQLEMRSPGARRPPDY
jgi:hypothetical protein